MLLFLKAKSILMFLTDMSDALAVGAHCHRQRFGALTMSPPLCIEGAHYGKNTGTLIFNLICFYLLRYCDMF